MAKVELPPGFQFDPTDDELVLYYLLPRVTNKPLPVQGLIQECDLYGDKHPWEIFEGQKSETTAYFFTKLKKIKPKAKVVIRTVGDKEKGGGKWKLQARGTQMKNDKGKIIGKKSSLSYVCQGKCGYETEWGRWTMKEYSLDGFLSGSALPDLGDIVLCRITNHQDYKRKTNQDTEFGATSSTIYDQEPPRIESTDMDLPVDIEVFGPATDFEISQQQQQEDLVSQGNNGVAMGDGSVMIQEPNMEGHGVLSHEEALNLDPFFCVDDGFSGADFQEQNIQEPDMIRESNMEGHGVLSHEEALNLDPFFWVDDGFGVADFQEQNTQEPDMIREPNMVGHGVLSHEEALNLDPFFCVDDGFGVADFQEQNTQEPDIEHQVPTQEEQEAYDLDYFLGISLDDFEDLPDIIGLADPGGPLFVDGIESIYMPDLQVMGKTDAKKDQSRKRTCVFDQEDDEVQINNKKIRQDEEAEDGWFLL